MEEFKEITDEEVAGMFGITTEEMYKEIEDGTFVSVAEERVRAYRLHRGDVLYCNTEFVKKHSYHQELLLGQTIYLYPENNSIRENGIAAKVVKVFKEKKYPNKRWWQFWIKQEEYVIGYNLEIL